MWPRHKRSPFEDLGLPRKLFISHSYKDAEARERLMELLPRTVEPFIFPVISAPPEQMVSDHLIGAILDCDGLIYLEEGHSAQSFWVALERDYALRARKPVFAFDPTRERIRQDRDAPLYLPVFYYASRRDAFTVEEVVTIMARQRYFAVGNLELQYGGAQPKSAVEVVDGTITQCIQDGGYVIVFWSESAAKAPGIAAEVTSSQELASRLGRQGVILAYLDDVPFEGYLGASIRGLPSVELFESGDRSQAHRIDDLIVRLYWLIYRNTRQNQLS